MKAIFDVLCGQIRKQNGPARLLTSAPELASTEIVDEKVNVGNEEELIAATPFLWIVCIDTIGATSFTKY